MFVRCSSCGHTSHGLEIDRDLFRRGRRDERAGDAGNRAAPVTPASPRNERSGPLSVAGIRPALPPVPRPGVGHARPRRPAAVRDAGARRRAGRPQLDHDPAQAGAVSARPSTDSTRGASPASRRRGVAAPARRPGHRPQPAEDRIGREQRQAASSTWRRPSAVSMRYIWQFVGGRPIVNARETMADVPARTPESDRDEPRSGGPRLPLRRARRSAMRSCRRRGW